MNNSLVIEEPGALQDDRISEDQMLIVHSIERSIGVVECEERSVNLDYGEKGINFEYEERGVNLDYEERGVNLEYEENCVNIECGERDVDIVNIKVNT